MPSAVLDASALLAMLQQEPGMDRVMAVIDDSAMSSVNYSEVLARLIAGGATLAQARLIVNSLGVAILPFDAVQAERAADLRLRTRTLGLSLGDRACLALAERERVPVLTADRAWRDVGENLDIQVIR